MSGWFAMNRAMFEHPIFCGKPERIAVWAWIISTAAWKDTRQDADGKTVMIKRGQVLTSYRQISSATGVGVQVIRTLIERLQSESAINTDTNNGRILITLCNYEKYQSVGANANTASNTTITQEQHSDNTAVTHKRTNKQNNNKDSIALLAKRDSRFDEFWAVYPHRGGAKRGKKSAQAKYEKALRSGVTEQALIDAARRYGMDRQVIDGFAKDPATWLHNECWNDDIQRSIKIASSQTSFGAFGHIPEVG